MTEANIANENLLMLLRWLHFLAGITWIGMLYFFNLVNVGLMKALDAPTKGKVIPELMPRTLFWFRWGAVFTFLSGFIYYGIIISNEPRTGHVLLTWIVLVVAAWALIRLVLRPSQGALNNGRVLFVLFAALALVLGILLWKLNGGEGTSTRAISIGIGGAYGTIMFLNVWLVIWPNQKKIIAWTKENAEKGTAIPPESAKLARQAFLASRTNAWLSIPMLFFMGAAGHFSYSIFRGGM
jgi:uncharacterized membrane protein